MNFLIIYITVYYILNVKKFFCGLRVQIATLISVIIYGLLVFCFYTSIYFTIDVLFIQTFYLLNKIRKFILNAKK